MGRHSRDASRSGSPAGPSARARSRSGSRGGSEEDGARARSRERGPRRSVADLSAEERERLKRRVLRRKAKEKKRSKKGEKHRKREKRERKEEGGEAAKRRRKVERKKKKVESFMGYTNENNPFGDTNLHAPFLWKKKADKEKEDGQSTKALDKEALRRKREANLGELEKVKERRSQRESEMEERERLRIEEQRLRDLAQFGDFKEREEEFHVKQARERSTIRIREGREKPIDMLAKNVILFGGGEESEFDPDLHMELEEPSDIIKGLPAGELRELVEDLDAYERLEGDGRHKEYWHMLRVLAEWELRVAEADGVASEKQGSGVHSAVQGDIEHMLGEKPLSELRTMDKEVERTLANPGPGTDVAYWEAVRRNLRVYIARASLREMHRDMLRKHQPVLEARRKSLKEQQAQEKGAAGGLSPALEEGGSGAEEEEVVEEGDEAGQLAERRAAVAAGAARRAAGQEDTGGLEGVERKLGAGTEVDLGMQRFAWDDRYRPRKPRYFNRVKTGYDWNKYNKTHYDHDNPPPKTVQGYKFNIFYPDLLDRSHTPTYRLEPSENPEFCIIRFSAGPPYEDIAFQIVNREWEMAKKHGFRCQFERGILQLYFNFKRLRWKK